MPVRRLAPIVALVVGLVALLFGTGDGGTGDGGAAPAPSTEAPGVTAEADRPAEGRAAAPSVDEHGLPIVAADDLPGEALDTLALIDAGGPFPYRQDGSVFSNRERLLPRRASGYYREYTVETPGSPDRGPRRIVAGEKGERYYTEDHYDSFARVEGT